MAKRINYDSMTVTLSNKPCEKALLSYYCLLIDISINKYGKDAVKTALEELIKED